METKLIFTTTTKRKEYWTHLPFAPHVNEWFNVKDILKTDELNEIALSAQQWSGTKGIIESVEYRHNDNDFYAEVTVRCEN
jgi:hypothetical protein